MTLEELKKEANALGYQVVKKTQKPEKLLPCVCGCNRREHWSGSDFRYILRCHRCGRKAGGNTKVELHHRWNEMVKKSTNNGIS